MATNVGYFTIARMALPDLPLTLFITVSVYAALVAALDRERRPRRWLLVAAAAAALGFLTKGPVAVVIPAIAVVPIVLLERRTMSLGVKDFALALLLFTAIALPWYGAMGMTHGPGYLEGFFIGDNYERFATARFNDPRPWWFYLPVLAGGLLPWTALMTVWIAPITQFLSRRRDIGTVELRLLMWAALPLIFYSLSVGKQPRYVLPVLPPVAMLLAGSILERTRDWRRLDGGRFRPRPSRSVVTGCFVAGLSLVGLAYLTYRAQSLFADVNDSLTVATIGVVGVLGALVAVVSLTRAWRVASALLAFATAVTFAVLPYGVFAAPADSAVRALARALQSANTDAHPVATYGVLVRNLVFYSGMKQEDLLNDEHVVSFARQHPGAYIVLPVADLARLERNGELRFERLAERRYFDEGQIKVGTLLEPDPATDLRAIALARVALNQPR